MVNLGAKLLQKMQIHKFQEYFLKNALFSFHFLQTITKIFFEFRNQFFLPMAYLFQATKEET